MTPATTTLTAAFWAVAAAHAGYCVGLPPSVAWVASLALTAAGVGVAIRARRRAARGEDLLAAAATAPPSAPRRIPPVAAVGAVLATAALLAAPARDALDRAVYDHDAVYIWLPKAAEVRAGVKPAPDAPPLKPGETTLHYHPEYPRGLPLLVGALGAFAPTLDTRPVRLAPLVLCALGLLAGFEALARRGNALGGLIFVVALGSLPLFVRHTASGYADALLAIAVLLAVVGLSPDAAGRMAPWTALGGAVAAAALKDEGMFAAAATFALTAWGALRGRAPRAWTPLLLGALCVLPWLVLKREAPSRGFLLAPSIPENLGLVWLRFERTLAEIGHLGFGLPDPTPGVGPHAWLAPGGEPVWWTLGASLLVVLFGGGRGVDVRPAALLLVVMVVAFTVTPDNHPWHVQTAAPRLALQATPAFLAAAAHRLTAARSARRPSPAPDDPLPSPA